VILQYFKYFKEKEKTEDVLPSCLPQAARSREGASLHPQGKPVAGFHLVTQNSDRDQSLTLTIKQAFT